MHAGTIFALSSAPGRAAISVVRVSGPDASRAFLRLTRRDRMPSAREAVLVKLHGAHGPLDRALCLWFPGPASATGEDMVEFHLHGGPAVVRGILDTLADSAGLRFAEPGEFTRRAFLHGKMDLTQAEGLADLIDAETEMQAAQAFSQMSGALGELYESWRGRIVRSLAYVEAVIDFPDEDVPDDAARSVFPELKSVKMEMDRHLADGRRGEILRDGLSVVILGPPNSGKSSLLNALMRRDIAIVSDIPGTTRDILEARLNIAGYAVCLADTAGVRTTSEAIEAEGIRRARLRAESVQVRLILIDPDSVSLIPEMLSSYRPGDLVVFSKSDLDWTPPQLDAETLFISTLSGVGLDDLISKLEQRARDLSGVGGSALITRSRHREALRDSSDALSKGVEQVGNGLDIVAENLRVAARAIGRITGRVDVEDVLDVVFADFCIGK